jgi:hypothetical protein
MPNWIAITKETLYEAKIAVVVDLCDQLLLADNQPARVEGIIQGVVDEIRNSVARRNQVDAAATKIPKGLRDLAVDLIVARLKNALDDDLTKTEEANVTYRRQQLRDIEKGDGPAIDLPDDAVSAKVEAANPAPRITARNRNFTTTTQDGI